MIKGKVKAKSGLSYVHMDEANTKNKVQNSPNQSSEKLEERKTPDNHVPRVSESLWDRESIDERQELLQTIKTLEEKLAQRLKIQGKVFEIKAMQSKDQYERKLQDIQMEYGTKSLRQKQEHDDT